VSTLPVPASVSRADPSSLVLRRPRNVEPPASARGRGRGPRGSERSLFVIDGPSVPEALGPPVVVISVNVLGEVDGGNTLRSPPDGSALSRMFRLPVVGDPYAEFSEPDRGRLVDEYV
jgi:hypothetical protein